MSYQRDFVKDNRIPVAIIGVGSHAYRNILPVMNYLPVRLIAVCDINENQASLTAEQYGCKSYTSTAEMYKKEPELAAVFISVGPKSHPMLVNEALAEKRHVWVEKPIATRAFQVEEMIENRGDQVVVVGLKKAFTPAAAKAKEFLRSEKYGNLRSILASYHMTLPPNGADVLKSDTLPNWLLNGVHPLAFLSEVGGKVNQVISYTSKTGHGAVLLRFASGVMGTLHLSSGPMPSAERYDLYADTWEMCILNHKIEVRRGIAFEYGKTTTYAPEGDDSGTIVWRAENNLSTLENKAIFTQGIYNECRYFCDCILEKKQPVTGSLGQAHEIMKIYEAALISKGKPISIK